MHPDQTNQPASSKHPAWLLPLAMLAWAPWQGAAAQALVGDEIAITTHEAAQFHSDTASNGSNYLVVWQDERNGDSDIYAQRVAFTGELTGEPIVVIDHDGNQTAPTAISDGSGYLVVWQDDRNGDSDIYGQRLTADGTPDGNAIVISSHNADQTAPVAGWDGNGYLVAWEDARNGEDIFGQRLTASGELAGGAFEISSGEASENGSPAMASNGSGFLVTWRQKTLSDIHARRVSSAGALEGDEIAVTADGNDQYAPAAASDGSGYLVLWQDQRNGNGDIFARRLAADGTLNGDEIEISTQDDDQLAPSVAWGGSGYVAVWQDSRNGDRDIYGHVLAADASPVEGQFLVTSFNGDQFTPAIAAGGTSYLVVWDDERAGSGLFDLYGQRIDAQNLMALPTGQSWVTYSAPTAPVVSTNPNLAMPLAFGDLATQVAPSASLPGFQAAVDTYMAYYAPALDADNLYFITSGGTVAVPVAGFNINSITEALRYRSNSTNAFSWSMDPIALDDLPAGTYSTYIGVTPHDDTDSYYIWETGFTLP